MFESCGVTAEGQKKLPLNKQKFTSMAVSRSIRSGCCCFKVRCALRMSASSGGIACVVELPIGDRVGFEVKARPNFQRACGTCIRPFEPHFRGCSSFFLISPFPKCFGTESLVPKTRWPQGATLTNHDISPLRFRFSMPEFFLLRPTLSLS